MPFAPIAEGQLHFDDTGDGAPVIALHGFSETGRYWNGKVAEALAEHFRFLPIDMRGHGRTTISGGFDVETMADDIDRLADHLKLNRFHLLGHATGSVVAARYAMRASNRLVSLSLTSAASATAMISSEPAENAQFFDGMVRFYERNDWDRIVERIRAKPWPFLHQLDRHLRRETLWPQIEAVFRENHPATLASFTASFYTDADTHRAGLRSITCPTLVVVAEHDELMLKPSEIILEEVTGAQRVMLPGVGHMTALEAPEALAEALVKFIEAAQQGRFASPIMQETGT